MELRTNGSAIRALRSAIGIRQDALAARVGIDKTYMSKIEHGARQPPIVLTARIADELGVKLDAITYPAPEPTAQGVPA